MTGLFCTSTFLCLRNPDTDKIGSEPGALERTLQSLSRSPLRSSRHRSYTACEMFYLTMTTNTSPCVSIMAAQYPLLLLRTELTFPTVLDIQVVWSLAHHSSAFQMDCSNLQSYQKQMNERASAIKTLPPLVICFYYHFLCI